MSSNMHFCLQESCIEENLVTQMHTYLLGHRLNMRMTNLAVGFMNIADVTVVVTVLVNFEIQIVLDL